jgi:hypothetical protein
MAALDKGLRQAEERLGQLRRFAGKSDTTETTEKPDKGEE